MNEIIRVFQNDTIRDFPFPEKGTFIIGGDSKNDCCLENTSKRESVRIIKELDGFSYIADQIQNDEKKGVVEKERLYIINAERVEAFALFEPKPEDVVIADVSSLDELLIGRKEDCQICIHSKQISRHHALLHRTEEGWKIRDLKSENRTFVNGKAVTETTLNDGDVVDISFCQIKVSGNSVSVRYSGQVELSIDQPEELRPYSETAGYPYAFKRSPRLKKEIPETQIEIQTAPHIGTAPVINWLSVLVTPLGSVGIMAIMVAVFGFSPMSLMFSAPMALIGVTVAILNYHSQKKNHAKREQARLTQYDEYLKDIVAQIKRENEVQRNILTEMHPTIKTCVNMVSRQDRKLWGKRIEDLDFLTLRIGTGDVNSKVQLQIPKEFLTLEKDQLSAYPAEIRDAYRKVSNCPITVDMLHTVSAGIIGERKAAVTTARNLIVQAATHHSYDELKIVVICSEEEREQWECFKWLPHVFDETRTRRFVAADAESSQKLLAEMSELTEERTQNTKETNRDTDRMGPQVPYYLFVFADYEMVKESSLVKTISQASPAAGVGAIFLFDEISHLPKECGMIIEVIGEKGTAYLRERANDIKTFTLETTDPNSYDSFARHMAPIRLEKGKNKELPKSISFLQGYGVRRPSEFNIEEAWQNGEPHESMSVPIGVRTNGEPFQFDIHEKKQGPHGLVAGMTGFGKSEMVQTWILSMALRFSPQDVSFVLIDFKGTGLILPFRNLPHLAGTISDLDTNIGRNLIALENELTRRKALLDKYEVNNITSYKKLYAEGRTKEPLAYLFVVIDEFAEFKGKFPEFMPVVDRIFATGRTLGVSMVLLTQKPTNVVDDKMSANTRFRWCLKVASSADSKDMLGRPDAAKLTNPGRAIVQVGEDELCETIQSYFSGANYDPYKDPTMTRLDKVSVVDLQGNRLSYESEKTTGYRSNKKEIDVIVEYLDEYVRSHGAERARNIWTKKLPDTIYLKQLLEIGFDGEKWADYEDQLQITIGLMDDPRSQSQYPAKINMDECGHLAVYGAPGTGKTTFLLTAAFSMALTYAPDNLHIYGLDFGGGNMNLLRQLPHVGGISVGEDEDQVKNMTRLLEQELTHRKEQFAAHSAMSVSSYEELSGEKLPWVVLLLDNFAPVLELYPDLMDFFIRLSREGGNYGIYWVVTANRPTAINYKIVQNITNAVALHMPDRAEYAGIVGRTQGLEPENIVGRGLLKGNPPLEFQTALPSEGGSASEQLHYIKNLVQLMNQKWHGAGPNRMKTMPEYIELQNMEGQGIALGLTSDTVEQLSYDPVENPFLVISAVEPSILEDAIYAQYQQMDCQWRIQFDGNQGICEMGDESRKLESSADFDEIMQELMPLMQERKLRKEENESASFPPIVVFLRNFKRCFDGMSNDSANRLNLLATLGENLNVILTIIDQPENLARLNYSGVPFVVSMLNRGRGIALGRTLRTHDVFHGELPFSEQERPLDTNEGWYIENNKCKKFRAINRLERK